MIKGIKVFLVEERAMDAWVDFSLRQVREGLVRFYRVKDFLTGDWLFKTCVDKELGKLFVKTVKCPPGKLFAQFEGDAMVFQKSVQKNLLYDIISTSYIDDGGRVRRKMIDSFEEIPQLIRENFQLQKHGEATKKQTPLQGKFVTLTSEDDHKSPIILFLIERIWPLSPTNLEEAFTTFRQRTEEKRVKKSQSKDLLSIIKKNEKARLEDIYFESSNKLGITKEEAEITITEMEKEGLLYRPEPDYIKSRR
jgi:hypothetical protein